MTDSKVESVFIILVRRGNDPRYVKGWAEGGPMMEYTRNPAHADKFFTRKAALRWLDHPNQSTIKWRGVATVVPLDGAEVFVPPWKRGA